ncbi:MAG: glycosyltransferase [Candidatus Paceibacterota bacterium]
MKILIATPLYPPDVAPSAQYVKELAKRLTAEKHSVIIVAYARIPEKIPGVRIIAVDKNKPLPLRVLVYLFALWRAARAADIMYVQNGPSVELPVTLLSFVIRTPIVVAISDKNAYKRTREKMMPKFINDLVISRARKTIVNMPMEQPEILPFAAQPTREWEAYNLSWEDHIRDLIKTFNHV